MLADAGAAQTPAPRRVLGDGLGDGACPRWGAEPGRRWLRASSANPNLIFPGPTPVSMETARSRNGNQNPETQSLKLPFAFLDSCSQWAADGGWAQAMGRPCSWGAGLGTLRGLGASVSWHAAAPMCGA